MSEKTKGRLMWEQGEIIDCHIDKRVFYLMYQNIEEVNDLSVVLTREQVEIEVALWAQRSWNESDELPPVFEPVLITKQEFDELEEFTGF